MDYKCLETEDELKLLIEHQTYLTSVFSTSSVTGAEHVGCHYSITSVNLSAGFLIINRNLQGLQYIGTLAVCLKFVTRSHNVGYRMFIECLPEIMSTFIITINWTRLNDQWTNISIQTINLICLNMSLLTAMNW